MVFKITKHLSIDMDALRSKFELVSRIIELQKVNHAKVDDKNNVIDPSISKSDLIRVIF